ncbi:hypothetical protein NDU88_009540 [Pleurodeles waltl]|uniref:Uncharacterized protein n=1 Tax=Pleurodeles waltl TaxID=8319 RepID=A0AAV7QTX5_PLEWA|nr:hypothetical protein NDU88_009540 [Pleurodeles waltl]
MADGESPPGHGPRRRWRGALDLSGYRATPNYHNRGQRVELLRGSPAARTGWERGRGAQTPGAAVRRGLEIC